MSDEIQVAKYTFSPWMRKGISSNILTVDDLGSGAVSSGERAKVPVDVVVNTETVPKLFSLMGPRDVIGINPNMIIRTEPRNWITNFEPNYLALIEFYDEDFIWRYTPANAAGDKLRPWIVLLVLKEDEFERDDKSLPLPAVKIKTKDALPDHRQTWAWGHAHTNLDFSAGELNELEKFLRSVNEKFLANPDNLYSRLICPRKLEANTAYHAFLVPAFEAGRLAGLNQPTTGIDAQKPAWDDTTTSIDLPIYHSWYFRTGANIDFEYLVELLKPVTLSDKVGIRDMDCSKPEFGIVTGTHPSILGLEGALKSPLAKSTEFPLLPRDIADFQKELQNIVNLSFTQTGNGQTGDPIITPPFYGSNHAKEDKLNIDDRWWVHHLNADPRNRVPSGFGTLVIQTYQEKFMRKAWQQVQKVLEMNQKVRLALISMAVGKFILTKNYKPLQKEKLIALAKPVLSKIKGSPATLHFQLQESLLSTTLFSGAFRKTIRPRGRKIQSLNLHAEKKFEFNELIKEVNEEKISAAPPKVKPGILPGTDDVINSIPVDTYPAWIYFLIKHLGILFLIVFILILILAVVFGQIMLSVFIAVAALGGFFYLRKIKEKIQAAEDFKTVLTDPAKAEKIFSESQVPPSFKMELDLTEENFFGVKLSDEMPDSSATVTGTAATINAEGINFKNAETYLYQRIKFSKVEEKKLTAFDVTNAAEKISFTIDPKVSFPKRLTAQIMLPLTKSYLIPSNIIPAMEYPDFEDPMYAQLRDISEELLVPNLNLIPQNSISLLETNQAYIESYMVGLNHEMGRELLWREYPTDQRGSYFRQFWDVKGIIAIPVQDETKTKEQLEAEQTEKYKDIKPIHKWDPVFRTELGKHNNRSADGSGKQVVLVVRGELLKRYPNTVIYAQKAIAGKEHNHDPHIKLNLADAEVPKELKFPLFKAEFKPDIKCFGFELTALQAKGTDLSPGFTDHDGWFFVIQEAPGEARFGMDITKNTDISLPKTWDNLSWEDFGNTPLPFIDTSRKPSLLTNEDDKNDIWGVNSAYMAYALFQQPVMVATHAKDMLKGL